MVKRLRYRSRLTIGVAGFGARPADRIKLAVFMLAMPVLKRLGRNWPTQHQLRLGDQVITWRADSDADLAIIEEIFGRRVYDLADGPAPEVVVDLGAHVGATVLFFALRFPEARILAAEPDPVNLPSCAATLDRWTSCAGCSAVSAQTCLRSLKETRASERNGSGCTPSLRATQPENPRDPFEAGRRSITRSTSP